MSNIPYSRLKTRKIYRGQMVLFLLVLFSCEQTNDLITPEYQRISEAVYASGYVMPANDYILYSLAEGYLSEVNVEEGDVVVKGEVLFSIKSTQQNARLEHARKAYELTLKNLRINSPILEEMRLKLENVQLQFHDDSLNYTRYRNLLSQNATSRQKYDAALLKYSTSQRNYESAKITLIKTKDQLLLAKRSAESEYHIYADQKSNFDLSSSADGKVYEIYKENGELVKRNEPIALLGARDKYYIQLKVDEMDIDKVLLKQKVLVQVDAYEGKIFEAVISKIYPMLDQKDQSFRVDAAFLEPFPSRFAGLSLEANIMIQEKEKALTIPNTYLIDQDTVLLMKGKKKEKVGVKVGLRNMHLVEVLLGIDSSSVLTKP